MTFLHKFQTRMKKSRNHRETNNNELAYKQVTIEYMIEHIKELNEIK